tara:strand:- start:157 stop:339 length:183 start_codon:yes stop_codon:yes gene_type:complete
MQDIEIGDRVRVINQDWITGTVVEDWGKRLVIKDDDAETWDDSLEFKKSELELIEKEEKS